jgi:hypothetical protein
MGDSLFDEWELERTARAVARRQRWLRTPTKATRLISDLFARHGLAQTQASEELATAWRAVVGETWAKQTRVGPIRRGVCEVTVANSALLQQISFQQRDILSQLQSRQPHFNIRQIRFRVGPVA